MCVRTRSRFGCPSLYYIQTGRHLRCDQAGAGRLCPALPPDGTGRQGEGIPHRHHPRQGRPWVEIKNINDITALLDIKIKISFITIYFRVLERPCDKKNRLARVIGHYSHVHFCVKKRVDYF